MIPDDYAVPSRRAFPIDTREHAALALIEVQRGGYSVAERDSVIIAVARHWPDLFTLRQRVSILRALAARQPVGEKLSKVQLPHADAAALYEQS